MGSEVGHEDACCAFEHRPHNYDSLKGNRQVLNRGFATTTIDSLEIDSLPAGVVSRLSLRVTSNALESINVPIFAFRSKNPGPVVGITCAVHGNEINGIPVIQKLFADIEQGSKSSNGADDSFDITCGTLIGVPVVNVPGFLASIRCFDEESKQDLNRLMPGLPTGTAPQQYAYAVFNKIVSKFDYVIDLHTASLGRRNSLYVRADMSHPVIGKLASLMQPQIIVHNATKGSLRGCAQSRGIHALTVEIGNPSVFQQPFILATYAGIRRVIAEAGMSKDYIPSASVTDVSEKIGTNTTSVCTKSFWIFSKAGGILHIFKDIAQRVEPGELLAEIQTIYGEPLESIFAPDYETVVVGVEGNPVAKTGNRVIHLGVVGDNFAPPENDGHL